MRVIAQARTLCWMGIRRANISYPVFKKNLKTLFYATQLQPPLRQEQKQNRLSLQWTCQTLGFSWAGSIKKNCLSWESFAGTWSALSNGRGKHQQFQFLLVRIRRRGLKHYKDKVPIILHILFLLSSLICH